jgi:DNA-binding beta-propeller fold protein YncE
VTRLALPGTPYGMAMDVASGTLWVTLTARNRVVGIDVRTDQPRIIASYATVQQPNTVAVAPGGHALWVTGTAAGVLQRIALSRVIG